MGQLEGELYTTCIFGVTTAVLSPRVGARKRAEGSHPQWNFRTRCSSVSTVGMNSFSPPGNSFSFTTSNSKMNLSAARHARPNGSRCSVVPTPGPNYRYTKVETQATCSGCGKQTTVPFRPTQGRQVFC